MTVFHATDGQTGELLGLDLKQGRHGVMCLTCAEKFEASEDFDADTGIATDPHFECDGSFECSICGVKIGSDDIEVT